MTVLYWDGKRRQDTTALRRCKRQEDTICGMSHGGIRAMS